MRGSTECGDLADHERVQRRISRRRHCPRSASRQDRLASVRCMRLGIGHLHQQQVAGLALLLLQQDSEHFRAAARTFVSCTGEEQVFARETSLISAPKTERA